MVRGEVGELVSIDGEKGTVKFEVAVTGGTRTWTDEYTVLRIHRDIVTLRAPGRMMRRPLYFIGDFGADSCLPICRSMKVFLPRFLVISWQILSAS